MPQLRAHVGIDPGQTGAVAVIVGRTVEQLVDTPTFSSGKGRKEYDEASMAGILRQIFASHPDALVTIEKVNAMPKQGVASSFNFGMGYGLWLGIIAAVGFSSQRVHPARWKKVVLADSAKVDQAVVACGARLYPAIAGQLTGPRGGLLMGRADALLLAHYGTLGAPLD